MLIAMLDLEESHVAPGKILTKGIKRTAQFLQPLSGILLRHVPLCTGKPVDGVEDSMIRSSRWCAGRLIDTMAP
jgi:hypothetical protein